MFANDNELFSIGVTVGEVLMDVHGVPVRPVKCNTCGEQFSVRDEDYARARVKFVPCPNKCNFLPPPADAATMSHVRQLNEILDIVASCAELDDFDEFERCIQRLKKGVIAKDHASDAMGKDLLYFMKVMDDCFDTRVFHEDTPKQGSAMKVNVGGVAIREEAADYIGHDNVVESPVEGVFINTAKREVIFYNGERSLVAEVE